MSISGYQSAEREKVLPITVSVAVLILYLADVGHLVVGPDILFGH